MVYKGGKANRSPSCVFVGNLPERVDDRDIRDIFEKFGEIRDIDIKRGRGSSYTCYAFIDFEEVKAAEDAVDSRDGYEFQRNKLRVEFAGTKKSGRDRSHDDGGRYPPPTRTDYRVVVSHLPRGCRWQHLKDHMRKAGPVGYVNVEGSRGHVDFMHKSDMKYALRKLDGSELVTPDDACRIKVRRDEYSSRSHRHRRSRSRSRSRSRTKSYSAHRGRSRSRSRSHDRHKPSASKSPSRSRYYSKDRRSRSPAENGRIEADEFQNDIASPHEDAKSPE